MLCAPRTGPRPSNGTTAHVIYEYAFGIWQMPTTQLQCRRHPIRSSGPATGYHVCMLRVFVSYVLFIHLCYVLMIACYIKSVKHMRQH